MYRQDDRRNAGCLSGDWAWSSWVQAGGGAKWETRLLDLGLFERPGLTISGRASPRENPDREDPGCVSIRTRPPLVG